MKKFKKLLVANRGEIAVRIMNAAREMNIKTVAICTDDEDEYPHVKKADEVLYLKGDIAADTYLNIDLILEECKKIGVDCIHPGYGFLSERSEFAKKVKEEKITFIGPKIENIDLMGDKVESKRAMEKIGIPLIPGFHGEAQDESILLKEANKIGTPLLIKAAAGGGGKGMRLVRDLKEFSESLAAAKREALKSFGDDRVLLEKFIENPRHIEVQILSDTHGQHRHLFERECSIQRRHQKILEESPSPALNREQRKKICEDAVKIASAISYIGAGTVEFILDDDGKHYFLEMNTRLQVEHPITEMVTAKDLVKWQIRVAQGEKITFDQDEVRQQGHAIELRIYAEDPENDFLPSIGYIQELISPSGPYIRFDSGVSEGNEVSVRFDPMIGKLVVWDETRELAISKAIRAIKDFSVVGPKTNTSFLQTVLNHQEFQDGNTFTHFIDTQNDSLFPKLNDEEVSFIIATILNTNKSKPIVLKSSASSHTGPWLSVNAERFPK